MYKGKNCWEFMNCGRQLDGGNVQELGVCPASTDTSFDGCNNGKNGGRICWFVAGTFCDGEVQCKDAKNNESCINCVFLSSVLAEDGSSFYTPEMLE
ncbi:two-CW domain-containing protein [Candidatus Latescibacterota bacterium]